MPAIQFITKYSRTFNLPYKLKVVFLFFVTFIPFSLLATVSQACLGDQSSSKHYNVYLIPRLPATQLFQNWSPLLESIGKKTAQCFDLIIPKTFVDFETAVLTGKADFALLNPYHQVMAKKAQGYIPLVRDEQYKLVGILVVNQKSSIQKLEDLDGKEVAFPAPNAYVASLLIRANLEQKGVHIIPQYVGSHSNVYRSVAFGDIVAGGGANTTLSKESKYLRSELRIIYKTDGFIPHPFSANPRVPIEEREKFIKVFLKLYDDRQGQYWLKNIQIPKPVRADYNRDYKELESFNLEKYIKLGGD